VTADLQPMSGCNEVQWASGAGSGVAALDREWGDSAVCAWAAVDASAQASAAAIRLCVRVAFIVRSLCVFLPAISAAREGEHRAGVWKLL